MLSDWEAVVRTFRQIVPVAPPPVAASTDAEESVERAPKTAA
jgi:hypothetical protein